MTHTWHRDNHKVHTKCHHWKNSIVSCNEFHSIKDKHLLFHNECTYRCMVNIILTPSINYLHKLCSDYSLFLNNSSTYCYIQCIEIFHRLHSLHHITGRVNNCSNSSNIVQWYNWHNRLLSNCYVLIQKEENIWCNSKNSSHNSNTIKHKIDINLFH